MQTYNSLKLFWSDRSRKKSGMDKQDLNGVLTQVQVNVTHSLCFRKTTAQ